MFPKSAQESISISTRRVVARLQEEGWVECSVLGSHALSQHAIADIRDFILMQLHQAGGWMWLDDLKLSALIFSIPAHQFEIHPQMQFMLKRLESEQAIEIRKCQDQIKSSGKSNVAVFLNTSAISAL